MSASDIVRFSFRAVIPVAVGLMLLATGARTALAQQTPCDQNIFQQGINNALSNINPQLKKQQEDCAKLKTLQEERDRLLQKYNELLKKMDQLNHRQDSIGHTLKWMAENNWQMTPNDKANLQTQIDQANREFMTAKVAVDTFSATISGNATGHSSPFPVDLRSSKARGESIGGVLSWDLSRNFDLAANQQFLVRAGAWHTSTKSTTAPWDNIPVLGASSVENRSWSYGGGATYRISNFYVTASALGDSGRSTSNNDYRLLGSATTDTSGYAIEGTVGYLIPLWRLTGLDLNTRVAYVKSSADGYIYASGLQVGSQDLEATVLGVQAKLFGMILYSGGMLTPYVRVAYDHAPSYSQTIYMPPNSVPAHTYDFLIDKSVWTFEAGLSGKIYGSTLTASYVHQDSSTLRANALRLSLAIPFGAR